MKKTTTMVIALLLAMTMVLGVFAGCSSSQPAADTPAGQRWRPGGRRGSRGRRCRRAERNPQRTLQGRPVQGRNVL